MVRQYKNEKGFLIIEMSLFEALTICKFGNICDRCNEKIKLEENCYYIAVLNMLFCKNCTDNYINNNDRFKEDIRVEKCNYNNYAKILGLELVP